MFRMIRGVSDTVVAAALDQRVGKVHSCPDEYLFHQFRSLRCDKVHRETIPPKADDCIRIVVIADTHTRHRCLGEIPQCDLLVHCGDIMMTGRKLSPEYQISILQDFNYWLGETNATERIVVGGNHDCVLDGLPKEEKNKLFSNARYMENEVFDFHGVRIWATPLSQGASGNRAFQGEAFTQESLQTCPSEVDILVTHSYCPHLTERVKHKLHLYGHVHWQYGLSVEEVEDASVPKHDQVVSRLAVCAPICGSSYDLTQRPIIIDYPLPVADIVSADR